MVVEWGRSAYRSKWHLFRDSPSTTTAGRYYFARPGTPHVPGFHILGSRNWNDQNHPHVQTLGEDLTGKQEWDAGYPPPVLPLNRPVGTNCLDRGSSITSALLPQERIDGFNALCFEPCGVRDDATLTALEFDSCQLQKFYARIIERMYADDGTAIGLAFYQLLGPGVRVTFHNDAGLMPAVTTVISPTLTVIVLDGTRFFQQLAVQGMTSLFSPTNVGGYGTVPTWWTAAQWAHTHSIVDGQQPGTPVMLVGHSYGAAAALVLAARYRAWNPARTIRFMTFGCPKPGDQRLADLVATCQGINLANDNDLVTVFPPDFVTLLPVMFALGAPQLQVWADWIRPVNQVKVEIDGVLDPNNMPMTDFDTLSAIAARILLGLGLNPISGHPITEYLARLMLRCPTDAWPYLVPCVPVTRPEGALVLTGTTQEGPRCGPNGCLLPDTFCVTFPGVHGGPECPDTFGNSCLPLQSMIVMTRMGIHCQWLGTAPFSGCYGGEGQPVFLTMLGTMMVLTVAGEPATLNYDAIYQENMSGWDCESPFTLSLFPGVNYGRCTDFPASVIVAACDDYLVVFSDDMDLCPGIMTFVVNGYGFDVGTPGDNVPTLNLGAVGTVTASTLTSVTITLSVAPTSTGALTLSITNSRGTSATVQVRTAVSECFIPEGWLDTFTGADGTSLAAHIPDARPDADGYTVLEGTWDLQSNRLAIASTVMGQAAFSFDPQAVTYTASIDVQLGAGVCTGIGILLRRSAGIGTVSVSLGLISGDDWNIVVTHSGGTNFTPVTIVAGSAFTILWSDDGSIITIEVNGVSLPLTTSDDAGQTEMVFMVGMDTGATPTFDNLMVTAP